jgi:hypothetical protein
MWVVFTGYSVSPHKKTDRHNITERLLKIADNNLNLMQILASDKIQEYVLKQMLIPRRPHLIINMHDTNKDLS